MIMVVAMLMTMLPVTASAAEGTTLYLQPNSNWLIDNARFAVYYWNGSGSGWPFTTLTRTVTSPAISAPQTQTSPSPITA